MSSSSTWRRTSIVLALAALGACKDSTSPPQPASVTLDQATGIEGTVGMVLSVPPTFEVRDANGHALGGVAISIAITAGGGTLTGAPLKTTSGPTPVGTWKLGNVTGINSITVTVSGLTPLIINVNAKAGPPASIVFTAGANQSVLAGTAVPIAPAVQVRDAFGNGVPGAPVTFAVQEGDGLVAGNPVTTDASGTVTSPEWILGKSASAQTLRASTAGGLAATISATVASAYNVDLRFFGPPMPPSTSALFTAAAARIRGAVVGDVSDIPVTSPLDLESGCGVPGLPTAFSETIDDVVIYASVGPIDGVNNILAFSFPCYVRDPSSADKQTVIGIMKFDSEDIDNMLARGNMQDVIQHEMLHIVGIGTLWRLYGLIQGAGTESSRYTGIMGINGCLTLGGASVCPASIPVENNGGAGTADAHWRESVFFNELMTGFVNTRATVPSGPLNPLSVMSIQSLEDLGYSINSRAADFYAIPGASASSALGQWSVAAESGPAWEKVEKPKFIISRTGRVTLVPKQ